MRLFLVRLAFEIFLQPSRFQLTARQGRRRFCCGRHSEQFFYYWTNDVNRPVIEKLLDDRANDVFNHPNVVSVSSL